MHGHRPNSIILLNSLRYRKPEFTHTPPQIVSKYSGFDFFLEAYDKVVCISDKLCKTWVAAALPHLQTTCNYFDNTNNAWDGGDNVWNTTKTGGTNIIGGPYLGGNCWSDMQERTQMAMGLEILRFRTILAEA